MNQRIAVIGGGIAGLTAAYLLHKKYDITVFEKSERIGGNAYTLTTESGEEVDIAVAAYGKFSYKNFFKLLSELKIETVSPFGINPFDMGMGFGFYNLDTKIGLFMSPGIRGLISQNFKILKPSNIKQILQLLTGLKKAEKLFDSGELKGLTVENALNKIPRIRQVAKLILIGGLCWMSSMYCHDVLDAPAGFFIEKLKVHNDLLPPKSLFSVRFAKNRTRSYIDALSYGFKDRIILNSKIRTAIRREGNVVLVMNDGEKLVFDKVVFACNADQALKLLNEPTDKEKRLLGAWKYTEGRIVVHNDHTFFPKRELMKGYTFLYRDKGRYIDTSISGSLWALPEVSDHCDLISTQHPNFPIDKDSIVFEKIFRTPIFDFNSCQTISDLPSLNGIKNTYYCGSHFGFGVHEDAVSSAMEIVPKLIRDMS
jgi:predicted NAD/FAD-binding protein